jgi:hypothetical protein
LAYKKGSEDQLEADMYAIEMIQVRLFDVNDGAKVIDAFNRITQKPPPFQTALFQNAAVGNDWSICFWKPTAGDFELKSPEAVSFAESLRSIGLVDHSLWVPVPADPSEEQLGRENMAPGGKKRVGRKGCP